MAGVILSYHEVNQKNGISCLVSAQAPKDVLTEWLTSILCIPAPR